MSVMRSSAPPVMRSTASPRRRWLRAKRKPSSSSPSHAATSSAASSSSSPYRGRPGQPEPVVAALGWAEGCERENVAWVNLLALAQRLEHRTAGELLRCVTKHRPVCDLARRRAPGADGVQDAAGAGCCEPVEVRGGGDLIGRAPAERTVRAVGEPVEQDDDDWVHRGEANRKPPRFRRTSASHACGFPRYRCLGEEVGGTSKRMASRLARDRGLGSPSRPRPGRAVPRRPLCAEPRGRPSPTLPSPLPRRGSRPCLAARRRSSSRRPSPRRAAGTA